LEPLTNTSPHDGYRQVSVDGNKQIGVGLLQQSNGGVVAHCVSSEMRFPPKRRPNTNVACMRTRRLTQLKTIFMLSGITHTDMLCCLASGVRYAIRQDQPALPVLGYQHFGTKCRAIEPYCAKTAADAGPERSSGAHISSSTNPVFVRKVGSY
jgi:hypothetical protein